ncbi:MAG: glutathione-dependent formaldehyde dehydrogenase [Proteobacteria bacterium]|nr:MAG: glutathione-dependent formaldehyde dehydrogenase [Pseudomonadota bacterium]
MPEIEHPRDAIVRVTRACICGSDLHLYHGLVPDTRIGQTFGHETVGIVEAIGSDVKEISIGDRVVVPFNIFCGECFFCQKGLYGNCHNTNPFASAMGGFYGYSHITGGYNGGQAEYIRTPFADAGLIKVPDSIDDDNAVLCADVYPTGYQAAEMANIKKGDSVLVFGAGPVGLIAAKCAWFMGAARVLIVDEQDYRLEFAKKFAQCETLNFKEVPDLVLHLKRESDWLVWDCAIDAVGCEASGSIMHRAIGIRPLKLQGGSPVALNWAIDSVRKGGTVSIIGVYGPVPNAVKIGDAMNKGITMRMNQASVKRNVERCFYHIEAGHINPKDMVTHRIPLEDISDGYHMFSSKLDGIIKPIVIPPRAIL